MGTGLHRAPEDDAFLEFPRDREVAGRHALPGDLVGGLAALAFLQLDARG